MGLSTLTPNIKASDRSNSSNRCERSFDQEGPSITVNAGGPGDGNCCWCLLVNTFFSPLICGQIWPGPSTPTPGVKTSNKSNSTNRCVEDLSVTVSAGGPGGGIYCWRLLKKNIVSPSIIGQIWLGSASLMLKPQARAGVLGGCCWYTLILLLSIHRLWAVLQYYTTLLVHIATDRPRPKRSSKNIIRCGHTVLGAAWGHREHIIKLKTTQTHLIC